MQSSRVCTSKSTVPGCGAAGIDAIPTWLVVFAGKTPTMGLLPTSTLSVGRKLSTVQRRIWLSTRITAPWAKPMPFWGTVTVLAGLPFTSHENPLPPGVGVTVGVMLGVGVAVGVSPITVAVGVTRPVRVAVAVAARVEVLVGVAWPVGAVVGAVTMPVGVLVRVAVTVALGPAVPPQKSDGIAARGAPHSGSARDEPSLRATSSVWDSMTRFEVLHGTHGVTLARNVGFLSMGHGYYLEDASEIDNRLCHNLGVSVRASLKEFFNAQADEKNWSGSPPAPSLAARYVPPILDGVCPGPEAKNCNCLNPKDSPDPPTSCAVTDDARVPQLRTGSDAFMPVTFWAMNAANEFVGNAAVGVHGFGSCYWLLGSGVSGPSLTHKFDGPNDDPPAPAGSVLLANYNSTSKGYQAPLRRFRGNSCTTAALALPAQAEIPPAPIPFKGDPYSYNGFTAIKNPSFTKALFCV
jgi:hypothetical protein